METKFTKGDWSILPIESNKEYIRIRGTSLGEKYKIANVIDLKDHHDNSKWCAIDRSESLANAHLIKAAPKLYAILDRIVEMQVKNYGDGMMTHIELISLSQEAKSLLAEARGERNVQM